MRIAYCTNVRLPSERAHGHQVARVCDALVNLGHDVHIFAPYRRNPIKNDYWSFHNADRRVRLTYLKNFDPINWPLPKFFQLLLLNAQLQWLLYKKFLLEKLDLLYTRTPALVSTLLRTNIPVVLELHSLPRRHQARFVRRCNRCALVVCLTTPMQKELVSWGLAPEKVIVEPDAVDLEKFAEAPRSVSPVVFNAPRDTHIVGYAGQLSSMGISKGISELLDALALLKERGHRVFALIAGPQASDGTLMHRLKHEEGARYCGFLPHEHIPHLLGACGILVYPAPASSHPFFQRDTSPLKIFEYMSARKPIVAADLPPLRDILNEESAFLCKPGDPASLAGAIERALKNPDEAKAKVEKAWQVVQEHTWEKRMQRIMENTP